jgi:hypothetical protein
MCPSECGTVRRNVLDNVLEAVSDERISYFEGMAAVKVNGKYGYIKKPGS